MGVAWIRHTSLAGCVGSRISEYVANAKLGVMHLDVHIIQEGDIATATGRLCVQNGNAEIDVLDEELGQ